MYYCMALTKKEKAMTKKLDLRGLKINLERITGVDAKQLRKL